MPYKISKNLKRKASLIFTSVNQNVSIWVSRKKSQHQSGWKDKGHFREIGRWRSWRQDFVETLYKGSEISMGNLLKPTMQLFCSSLRHTEDQFFSLSQACFCTWNCTCYPQNWLQLLCWDRSGCHWLYLCTHSLRKTRQKCRLFSFACENWNFLSKLWFLLPHPVS